MCKNSSTAVHNVKTTNVWHSVYANKSRHSKYYWRYWLTGERKEGRTVLYKNSKNWLVFTQSFLNRFSWDSFDCGAREIFTVPFNKVVYCWTMCWVNMPWNGILQRKFNINTSLEKKGSSKNKNEFVRLANKLKPIQWLMIF